MAGITLQPPANPGDPCGRGLHGDSGPRKAHDAVSLGGFRSTLTPGAASGGVFRASSDVLGQGLLFRTLQTACTVFSAITLISFQVYFEVYLLFLSNRKP